MIKDKLKTINDNDAIEVAKILLVTSTSSLFDFTFEKITRQEYVQQHGVDSEESVNVYFNAVVKNESYKKHGWKDKKVMIQLIESDRYHNHPYFSALYKEEVDEVWKYYFLSNHIAAVEYLQQKQLL